MATTIDTHATVKELKGAGFSEDQAEVLARTLRDVQQVQLGELATKSELRHEAAMIRQEIKAEITSAQNSLLRWLVVLLLGQVGLILAGVRLLGG